MLLKDLYFIVVSSHTFLRNMEVEASFNKKLVLTGSLRDTLVNMIFVALNMITLSPRLMLLGMLVLIMINS